MAPKTRSKQATPETGSSSTAVQPQLEPMGETKQRARESSRTREELVDANYALDLANEHRENVYLFVPNIIGYVRVLTAAFSFYVMPYHPRLCFIIYGVSCLLDAVDGQTARALGQTSKFGAVLDMVVDRCTTACLLTFLASTYPDHSLTFMFLITLDFSSHYIHMYSSLVTGSSSHKAVTSDVSRILWYYYNDSVTLFIFCFANELFFVCLYLNAFLHDPIHSSFPLSAFFSAPTIEHNVPRLVWLIFGFTWSQVFTFLTLPICAAKQVINVVQFWKASKILVGVDLAERQAAREAAVMKARGL